MKNHIKFEFYIQLVFFIIGLLSAIIGIFFDFGVMLFYFVVGIPQLISFLIRAFSKEKKSIVYIVYGIFIIPVWISLMIVFGLKNEYSITNFFGTLLIISLIYSPILSVMYLYDAYQNYKSIK